MLRFVSTAIGEAAVGFAAPPRHSSLMPEGHVNLIIGDNWSKVGIDKAA